jgi:hypothetical protein
MTADSFLGVLHSFCTSGIVLLQEIPILWPSFDIFQLFKNSFFVLDPGSSPLLRKLLWKVNVKGKGKGKVAPVLFLNWATRHEGVLWEWKYSSTHSLNSALDGGEWSASRPGRFTPKERAPAAPWIGGWVGRKAVLDTVVKRRIPSPRREWNSRTPIVLPVAQRYTDWTSKR